MLNKLKGGALIAPPFFMLHPLLLALACIHIMGTQERYNPEPVHAKSHYQGMDRRYTPYISHLWLFVALYMKEAF